MDDRRRFDTLGASFLRYPGLHEGCRDVLIDNVDIAGTDHDQSGRHRSGGGIIIENGNTHRKNSFGGPRAARRPTGCSRRREKSSCARKRCGRGWARTIWRVYRHCGKIRKNAGGGWKQRAMPGPCRMVGTLKRTAIWILSAAKTGSSKYCGQHDRRIAQWRGRFVRDKNQCDLKILNRGRWMAPYLFQPDEITSH